MEKSKQPEKLPTPEGYCPECSQELQRFLGIGGGGPNFYDCLNCQKRYTVQWNDAEQKAYLAVYRDLKS